MFPQYKESTQWENINPPEMVKGPLTSRNSNTPGDLYQGLTYYIINALLWIHVLLMIAWVCILLYVNIPHTYFQGLGVPGPANLFSMRYHSLLWVIFMMSGLRLFIPIMVRFVLVLRDSPVWAIAGMLVLGLLVVTDLLVFAGLSEQYLNANKGSDPFNFCNDLRHDCVFFDHPLSERSGPCQSPIILASELQRNGLCKIAYWLSWPHTLIGLAIFMWILMVWLYPPEIRQKRVVPEPSVGSDYKTK